MLAARSKRVALFLLLLQQRLSGQIATRQKSVGPVLHNKTIRRLRKLNCIAFHAVLIGNQQMISSFVRLSFVLFAILPVFLKAQPGPENLKVTVVEGEGGINNIRQHTTQTPTVRVED